MEGTMTSVATLTRNMADLAPAAKLKLAGEMAQAALELPRGERAAMLAIARSLAKSADRELALVQAGLRLVERG
jgi:hypothetical protein